MKPGARSLRNLAFVLLSVGLLMGTVNDRREANQPSRAGEYVVFTGDFHVHAFPGDGALTAWDLRAEARRRQLDVITISNHNHMVAARIGRAVLRRDQVPIVIPGQEVTARDFHIIALGIERVVNADQNAASVIDSVHAQGGVAIAAHPISGYWRGYDSAALERLDGTEVAHPAGKDGYRDDLLTFYRRTLQRSRPIAAIGSSDYHFGGPLGVCRTVLFLNEVSEAGVLEAIRAGRTVAVDLNGAMYGDSALISRVDRQAILAPARAGPAAVVSTVFVWLGLFGVAVLGGTRRRSVLP